MLNSCVFCREINGSRDTNFARLYPEISSRFICQTDEFIAFPCIGQLVKGHFLIVPKKHFRTLKESQLFIKTFSEELREIIDQSHKILNIDINNSLYFEHGALGELDGGCGIYHAHLHIVPNVNHIMVSEIYDFATKEPSKSLPQSLEILTQNQPYVLVGNMSEGFYSCNINESLVSQTLRKSVASALHVSEWDWRTAFRENNMISILAEGSFK